MPLPTPLEEFGDWLGLVAAVVAAFGTVKVVGLWLAATVGRRWQLARKIERLVPGMRTEAFREALGAPTFGDDTTHTWVFPECFVHAGLRSEQVEAVAVTLRRPWFRVAVAGSGATLGKATFAAARYDLGSAQFTGAVGANRWGYAECWPSISASNFQEVAFCLNDAGVLFSESDLDLAGAADGGDAEKVKELRRHVKFNTVAIAAPGAHLDSIQVGPSFGVSVYDARLAPKAIPRWLMLPVLRRTAWRRAFSNGK